MYSDKNNIYEDPLFPVEDPEQGENIDRRNGGYEPSIEEILEECEYILGLTGK